MNPNPGGTRLITWVVLGSLVVVVAALSLSGLFTSGRVSNETQSWTSLKTLSTAEADFRANDRDWNHVNDYWTGDVKSLYTLTSCAIKGTQGMPDDPPIKLIELAAACSDVDGTLVEAGGENMPLSSFSVPNPRRGYWHVALNLDLTAPGSEGTYKVDTGGSPPMGSCHNLLKFGFMAVPDSGSVGSTAYIINQECTVFRTYNSWLFGRSKERLPAAPGLKWIPADNLNWPDERTLKASWSRFD